MINWAHWHNEPYLIGGLVLFGWAYALLVGPFRDRWAPPGTPFPRGSAACFYGGLAVFYLAVGSPLDQIGEQFLFWAHMVQHLLLTVPAAILILFGLPAGLVDVALRRPPLRRFVAVATHPVTALLTFLVIVGAWHAPSLYDLALRNKAVHVLEHILFFGSALPYWWPVFSPSKLLPALRPGAALAYLFAMMVGNTPLFAYLVFNGRVLYPTYEFAPRVMDLSPMEDQILGGVLMQLGGVVLAIGLMAWAFARWYRQSGEDPARAWGRPAAGSVP